MTRSAICGFRVGVLREATTMTRSEPSRSISRYRASARPYSAEVSSDFPTAIRPVLEHIVAGTVTEAPKGFHVDAWIEGTDARELNRDLLSALRRVERRTRLRSEWTAPAPNSGRTCSRCGITVSGATGNSAPTVRP